MKPTVPPAADPEFLVLMRGDRPLAVYFRGVQIRNVRAVDVLTTATITDAVRSRISLELVGETIPVRQYEPEEAAHAVADEPPA